MIPFNLVVSPIQWDISTEFEQYNTQNQIPKTKVFVPEPLRNHLMEQIHNQPSSGHPGITASLHVTQSKFWWSTLKQDVTQYVKHFDICNKQKASQQLPAGLLQPLPLPQRPWSHIAIDFITDLPVSNHCTTILTIVDHFSKGCHLFPSPNYPPLFKPRSTFVTGNSACTACLMTVVRIEDPNSRLGYGPPCFRP